MTLNEEGLEQRIFMEDVIRVLSLLGLILQLLAVILELSQ
jgi:hypothetical protein